MRNKMLLCSGIMNLEKIKKAIVKSAGEINTSKGSKRTGDLKLSLYFILLTPFWWKKKIYIYFIYVSKLQRFWKYIDI